MATPFFDRIIFRQNYEITELYQPVWHIMYTLKVYFLTPEIDLRHVRMPQTTSFAVLATPILFATQFPTKNDEIVDTPNKGHGCVINCYVFSLEIESTQF